MGRSRYADNPQDKAEGRICGFAYNTELVSQNGVSFHVWLGDTEATPELLARLEKVARSERDVVYMTHGKGEPIGFWANHNIGGDKP